MIGEHGLVVLAALAGVLVSVAAASAGTAGAGKIERWEVFRGGQRGYHTVRIPAVAVSPGGAVLVFAEGRKDSPADDGDIDLILRRSTDGGQTWSAIQVVHSFGRAEGVEATTGNPCPIVDRQAGKVVLLFCRDNATAWCTVSDDDGRTWSRAAEITPSFRRFDYPGLTRVATGPVHGIRTGSGRLVAPVWVSKLTRPAKQRLQRRHREDEAKLLADVDVFRCGVIFSDDGGDNWQAGGLVPTTIPWLNESTVYESADGSLVLNSRAHRAGFRARSVSTDGGRTWSEPVLRRDLPDPTCQAAALKLTRGPLAGAVVFSNLDQARPQDAVRFTLRRRNLTVRLSVDDGKTWGHKRAIEPGPSGYSDLAELPDGRVVCVFEHGKKVYRERVSLVRFPPAWVRGGGGAGE